MSKKKPAPKKAKTTDSKLKKLAKELGKDNPYFKDEAARNAIVDEIDQALNDSPLGEEIYKLLLLAMLSCCKHLKGSDAKR